MNAEIINPFIQGTKQILKNVCDIESKMGAVSIKNRPFEEKLNINIGIVGAFKGQVIYTFEKDVFLFLASKMMFMDIKELDEISKSAVCELCNMISGTTATIFSNLEKIIDIKPPILSENFNNCSLEKFISIPLEFEQDKIMEINIWIEG